MSFMLVKIYISRSVGLDVCTESHHRQRHLSVIESYAFVGEGRILQLQPRQHAKKALTLEMKLMIQPRCGLLTGCEVGERASGGHETMKTKIDDDK